MWSMRHPLGAIPLLVSLLCGAMSFAIHAQAVDGLVPGPLTSEEFDRWLVRLDVSHEERIAAEAAHERYKAAYRRFRDDGISSAIREWEALWYGERDIEGAHAQSAESSSRLRNQLAALDRSLINELRAQWEGMRPADIDFLQLLRDRVHARFTFTQWMGQGNFVDLAALVRRGDLPAGELAAMEPVLEEYATDIFDLERRYADANSAWRIAVEKARRLHAFEDPNHPGEERLPDWALDEARTEVSLRLVSTELALRDANIRWARRLEAALPQSAQRRFREDVGQYLYLQAFDTRLLLLDELPVLVARHEIGEEGRLLGEECIARYHAENDELIASSIESIDAYHRMKVEQRLTGFEASAAPDLLERLLEFRRTQQELQDRLSTELTAIFDEHAPQRTTRYRRQPPDFLLSPATESEAAVLAVWYGLEGDAAALATHFWSDYRNRWEQFLIARWQPVVDEWMAVDIPHASVALHLQLATKLRDARIDCARELERLDGELIAVIEALSPASADVAAVTRAMHEWRSRQRINPDRTRQYSHNPPLPDLGDIIVRTVGDSSAGVLISVLELLHQPLLTLLQQRHYMLIDAELVRARERPERERTEADGQRWESGPGTPVYEAQQAIHKVEERYVDTTLIRLDRVMLELEPQQARRVQEAFLAAAYPSTWRQPETVRAYVKEAIELHAISANVRTTLLELSHEYEGAHADLQAELMKQPAGNNQTIFEIRAAVPWLDRPLQLRYRSLVFDRRELNATTLRRVRALLTAEQAAEWDAAAGAAAHE